MRTALAVSIVIVAGLLLPVAAQPGSTYPLPSPVERTEFFSRLLSDEWKGRPVDELISLWGMPAKTEAEQDGRSSLLYKIRLLGGFQFTPSHHVALSIDGPYPVAGIYISVPGVPETKVVGKLKVRFRADPKRVVEKVEVLSMKWTGGRRHHKDPGEEKTIEPPDLVHTDVKIEAD